MEIAFMKKFFTTNSFVKGLDFIAVSLALSIAGYYLSIAGMFGLILSVLSVISLLVAAVSLCVVFTQPSSGRIKFFSVILLLFIAYLLLLLSLGIGNYFGLGAK